MLFYIQYYSNKNETGIVMKKNKTLKIIVILLMSILAVVCLSYCSNTANKEKIGASDTLGESITAQEPESNDETLPHMQETSNETEPQTIEETVPETEPATEAPPETTPPPPGYVAVTGITLSVYSVNLQAGDKQMPIVTMAPANATDKGEIWKSSDTSVATVDIYGNITGISQGKCTVTVTSASNPTVSANVSVSVSPAPAPTYIDGILVVNKTYALPKSYAPGWDAEASAKIWEMIGDAQKEGLKFRIASGYRSYIDQSIIYNNYVAVDGQAAADRYSARPGHSEHQSGLAFDLSTTYFSGLTQEFANTPEGIWLAENCHKYGFIIRYPKEKEHITGYMYEPWHVRYLGVEKAAAVRDSGLCLEEYLGITSSYS